MELLSRKKRGFALITALLLAAATVAVAVGLHVAAGGVRVSAIHTTSGEQAEVIAAAGLQRAEAYALAASKSKKDFDKVLDPKLEANCDLVHSLTNTSAINETGDMGVPMFDGDTIVTFNNKRWSKVSFNGGAYLARFDDNDDDAVAATGTPDWTQATNNNVGSVGTTPFCTEGPAPPGLGIQNKYRDRDRAIWLTVIGIYPGTDPSSAQHKSIMRKLIVDNRVVGPSAFRTGGAIAAAGGGAVLEFCSTTSGVSATGILTEGNANSCGCGTVNASNNFTLGQCSASDCDPTGCGTNTYVEQDSTPGTPPNEPTVTNAKWYDWSSSCTFYMGSDGLYFWDASAARGPTGQCSTYAGAQVNPSTDKSTAGSCWVPLFRVTPADVPITALQQTGAYVSSGDTEVVSCGGSCWDWRPRNKAVGYDLSGYYVSGTGSPTGTKPNWASCPDTAATRFKWNPPSSGTGSGSETPGCTQCDGQNTVLSKTTTAWTWNLNDATDYPYLPTATFVHEGNLTWSVNQDQTTAQSPMSQWPMMTLIVKGNLTLNGGDQMAMGVGTRKNEFPSMIVDGNFAAGSGARFAAAGSVYIRGNYSADSGGGANGGHFLFGQVVVNGDVSVANGGRFFWDYDVDLLAASANQPKPPRLAFPMGF